MNNILEKIIKSNWADNERVALVDSYSLITYKLLDKKTNDLSKILQMKIKQVQNTPILIYMDRGINFIISILAILKAGGTYIPVENGYPLQRIKYIIDNSKAELILCDNINNIANIANIDVSNGTFILNINNIDENYTPDIKPYNNASTDDDLCYIIYTSGSTGTPKGVKISYGNLFNLVEGLDDKIYSSVPGYSNIALISSFLFDSSIKQIFCAVLLGHRLIIADNNIKYFPKLLIRFYIENEIYLSDITPTLLNTVLKAHIRIKKFILPKVLLVGGEVMTWKLINYLVNSYGEYIKIYNVYGPSECCVDVSCYNIDLSDISKDRGDIVPIGKALKNIKLGIYDRERNLYIEDSYTKGELCISGKCIGAGYTEGHGEFNIIHHNGVDWYGTGDLSFMNNDGNYVVNGRYDDQVKVNGYRIELGEISNCLLKNPNIGEAFTFLYENKLYAVYTLNNDNTKNVNMKEFMKQFLPEYMLPAYAIRLNEFPFNNNGKVDAKMLIQRFKNNEFNVELTNLVNI
jgi:amino acid adenylation domain-containing protein